MVSFGIGAIVVVLTGIPLVLWWAVPRQQLVDGLTDPVWNMLSRDPYFQSLAPDRQEAVLGEVAAVLWTVYPKFALLCAATGLCAGCGVIILGRYLRRLLPETFDPRFEAPSTGAGPPALWVGPVLAALAGMVAHLPYLPLSLNIDETTAIRHFQESGWYWIDTRWGWQVHVGGLLLVRLSAALFGYGELAVRLPAAVVSSAALGVLYAWVRSRMGSCVAVLTVAVIALWPNWAEQCAAARGYGLSFACGVLALICVWRLVDDEQQHMLSGGAAIWILFIAMLLGGLAHAFVLFFGFACLVILICDAVTRRRALSAAAAVFSGTALACAGLVYLPGLPSILMMQMSSASASSLAEAFWQRCLVDFGFRCTGSLGVAVNILVAGLAATGLLFLDVAERRRVLVILLLAGVVPVLFRPVYLYPRYFMHLTPLWYIPMLPLGLVLDRLLRPRAALATAIGLILLSMLVVRPWAQLPMVDLRSLASFCRDGKESDPSCVIDSSLRGASVYGLTPETKVLNLGYGIPPDTRRVALPIARGSVEPDGFESVRVLPGWDTTIVIYRRKS